jgi:glutathione S-transferase
VLQIGADIYCDTALICDVLEHLAPTPTLYPEAVKGAARIVAQWADSALFTASMAYNFQPAGVAQVFAGAPAEGVQAFAADRAAMRSGAARMASTDAAAAYKSYLRRMANMLHGQEFLFGVQPCVADFAAYHPLCDGDHAHIRVHTACCRGHDHIQKSHDRTPMRDIE